MTSRPRFGPLLLLSFIGTTSHPLLDFTNSYGWRPFLPFSDEWHYIDLTFVVDPWIWLALGATVFLARARSVRLIVFWIAGATIAGTVLLLASVPLAIKAIWVIATCVCIASRFLFRIDEKAARELNIASVSAVVLYIVALAILHVVAMFRSAEVAQVAVAPNKQIVEVNALPVEANPLKWRAIVSTEDGYHVCDIDLLQSSTNPSMTLTDFPRLTGDAAGLEAISGNRDAATFLRFARYPVARVSPGPEGETVEVEDIRFGVKNNAFRIRVDLDKDLKPVRLYR